MSEAVLFDEVQDGRMWIETPEGVEIALFSAPVGRRVLAFLCDLLAMGLLGFGIVVFCIVLNGIAGSVTDALIPVLSFVVLNFYFPCAEGLGAGMSPGKRMLDIRVVDRRGGALTWRAVVVRNFMRDIELWLPFQVVVMQGLGLLPMDEVVQPVALIWGFCMVLLPLGNRARMRLGDLLAGTMVVEHRVLRLPPEVTQRVAIQEVGAANLFSREQLSIYGEKELQVLESVLRRMPRPLMKNLRVVAETIQKKIGWEDRESLTPRAFLEAFYKEQRAFLEKQLVLGRRRRDKYDD